MITSSLSQKNKDLLLLLYSPLSSKEIGRELALNRGAYEQRTMRIYRKLGCEGRVQLMARKIDQLSRSLKHFYPLNFEDLLAVIPQGLTEREVKLFALLCSDLSVIQIRQAMGLREGTYYDRLKRFLKKTGFRDRTGLMSARIYQLWSYVKEAQVNARASA